MCTIDNFFTFYNPYFSYILRAIVARIEFAIRIQEKLFWLETPKNEEQTGVASWFFADYLCPLKKLKCPFKKLKCPL